MVKTVLVSHFGVGEFPTHFRTYFSGHLNVFVGRWCAKSISHVRELDNGWCLSAPEPKKTRGSKAHAHTNTHFSISEVPWSQRSLRCIGYQKQTAHTPGRSRMKPSKPFLRSHRSVLIPGARLQSPVVAQVLPILR